MAISDEHESDDSSAPCAPNPPPPLLLSPPLSINQLLALHPRERLQVHPLRWTDRQPTLLGCRIYSHFDGARSAAADKNAEPVSPKSDDSDRLADFLAKRLNEQLDPKRLGDTVIQLLAPLDARRILVQMKYVYPMPTAHVPPSPTSLHVLTDPGLAGP